MLVGAFSFFDLEQLYTAEGPAQNNPNDHADRHFSLNHLYFLKQEPLVTNLRISPGIRHRSRLWTKPGVFQRPESPNHNVQLKLLFNKPGVHLQTLMQLNESKNIFIKQLPNMGASYITKLVFDFDTITASLIQNGLVVGAINGRFFKEERFIEIAFCSVASNCQQHGFGRLCMNYLKYISQVFQYYDIITSADNNAVIYFRKLGFNREIRMDPARWVRRIKDYESVTLVHSPISPIYDYLNSQKILHKQIELIEKKAKISTVSQPYQILNRIPAYQYQPSVINIPMKQIYKMTGGPLQFAKDSDQNKNLEQHLQAQESSQRNLCEKFKAILEQLEGDPTFKIFYRPVTERIAPNYFEMIHYPMDFQTIHRRLEAFPSYYKRPEMFEKDINLIASNCQSFNPPDSQYFKNASALISKYNRLAIQYGIKDPDMVVYVFCFFVFVLKR